MSRTAWSTSTALRGCWRSPEELTVEEIGSLILEGVDVLHVSHASMLEHVSRYWRHKEECSG